MISIKNVNKWYGDFQVLTDCSTEVSKGEVVVVCGPSGSGKSTLIKCVNALEPFQKGDIVVDGTSISDAKTNLPKLRSRVGMVFQHFELFPHLSIVENLTIAQHDHDVRDPRNGFRAQSRQPGDFHGQGADCRRLRKGRVFRRCQRPFRTCSAISRQNPSALGITHSCLPRSGSCSVQDDCDEMRLHSLSRRAAITCREASSGPPTVSAPADPPADDRAGLRRYLISEHNGIKSLRESGERQLELHASTVESEISKYTYLPSVLELESSVSQLLNNPGPELQQQVNRYLEGLNRRSRSRAIYVMDTTGRVLATSNWRDADSYQGEDLSFRAYFQDAVRGLPGRFYGIGSTSGESGYYLAHGLEDKGRIIGVAVIKVSLEALEERWQRARLEAFVTDENGIIILSSDPARRLKSVRPLTPEIKERMARSLQYYWWPLNELVPLERETLSEGVEKLTFPANVSVDREHTQVSYLAQTRPLNETSWHFTLLTPLEDLRSEAASRGMLVAVACALVTFLLIAWNERRKVISTRLAAREALQAANDELERKIAERTEHLRASNERLKAQIRERRQAERHAAPGSG